MSFVDGFYTFSLQIMHIESNVYESIRIKTPKHPEETLEHLTARVLALAHSFETGIEFSEGVYRPELPAIQVPDGIGGLKKWVDVGSPDPKKIRNALNSFRAAYSVYFFSADHLQQFCHAMRGTKKNWLAPVLFFSLPARLIEELVLSLEYRNHWACTFIDSTLYLETEGQQYSGIIQPLDIWHQYQIAIGNSE